MRRTSERWPEVRPVIRVGREAAAIDRELGNLVERWMDEAISDIEDGLTEADRFEPIVRHFEGVLAMAELDFVAQNYDDGAWKIDREQMLEELTASWVRILGAPQQ